MATEKSLSPKRPAGMPLAFAVIVGMMTNMPSVVGATFSLFLLPVSQQFGWGRDAMSTGVLIAFTATTALYPLVGRIVDRRGARFVVLPGTILLGAAVMSLAFLHGSVPQFDVQFFLVAAAGTLVSGVVYGRALAGVFNGNRGKALGICLGVGGGLGAALSPPFAHMLIARFGWPAAYVGLGLVPILVTFPVALLLLRGERPATAALARPTEAAVHFGLTVPQAIRQRGLWLIFAAIFLSCLANNGLLVHLAPLLTDRGTSLSAATAALSTVAVATTVGQFTSGFMLDRIKGPRVGIPFALSVLIGLLLIDHGSTSVVRLCGVACFGLGIGSEYSLMPYYISRYFGLRSFGQLYGGIYAFASIAGGLGPFVMGRVFEDTHSYRGALVVFEIGIALTIVCIASLGRYIYAPGGDAVSPVSHSHPASPVPSR
jgi:MFS family permease